ncbi:MAG: IS1380 family transposase, partial [Terriglobia bacterium]
MTTECIQSSFGFEALGKREVVARFDGGDITSDAGALLLREVERRTGIVRQLAGCFSDYRKPEQVEHTVAELIAQRLYGLALGYEDLNDHDRLRHDPMLGVLAGKRDPQGRDRRRERDRGKATAGKCTLNRLELTPADADARARYKKIVMQEDAVDELLVKLFLQAHREAPEQIVLDLDATDDPVHGAQQGRFFHGYYGHYCYLPLYIFCGEFVLCARLRPSNIDASAGSLEEIQRIVGQIRRHWPGVPIVLRADSGFCRDPLMNWCEEHAVDYVFGLAKNKRLCRIIGAALQRAKEVFQQTGESSRSFSDFSYRTRQSWRRARRVVAKAEH